MSAPYRTLSEVCGALGLEAADSLRTPTWNGAFLEEIYPWGTIRKASPEHNLGDRHGTISPKSNRKSGTLVGNTSKNSTTTLSYANEFVPCQNGAGIPDGENGDRIDGSLTRPNDPRW